MSEEKEYPSLFEQGKNLAEFSFELIKRALMSEALLVSDEVQSQRMQICTSCEKYDKLQDRCVECGCFIQPKTRYALDSCPLHKWKESNIDWMNGKFDTIIGDIEKNES
jgi:hypothetical protein